MDSSLLGKKISAPSFYDPQILFPIARSQQRLNLPGVKFEGVDIWYAYEVSWLDLQGKACVKIGRFIFDANSEFLVESKSLKLYLNSFNNTRFESAEKVAQLISKDLSAVSNSKVEVELLNLDDRYEFFQYDGICLDSLEIEMDYEKDVDTAFLARHDTWVKEKLYTNLFKSNCLVTNQADWASLYIEYEGYQMDYKGLLKYLLSYRNHSSFHEHCVENVYHDLLNTFECSFLSVYGKYTRRGGLDIAPYRATKMENLPSFDRTSRQ
ncbi:7-cyano-7-deazaguanine reductase [Candidatus Phycorickettsia trachydisci]|uniref:7-cyano-7-deazaguanine reductase n=1 Tax=Candidatus Phycorickettsia trachydisci TaxID=2115978 RepID=A0A2P1P881_9RICK|nr:NADPH-dependent 7-cyano-7-deazaguanine reductase QueF [Candidatus Phycorickettsia trachydisci]AVP87466.1 7-cyano-7-deazaguanine reductase [Candidatus Phycorickettsia trachydisci]